MAGGEPAACWPPWQRADPPTQQPACPPHPLAASNPQLVQPALKPGLQPGLGQPITAAQIAARAAAAQGHMRVGGVQQAAPAAPNPGAAAALAAAQAKAAQLAARLAAQQR